MVVGVVRDDDAGDGGARDPGAHEDDEPSRRLRRLVRLGVGAAHDGRAESSDVARRQGEAERQPAERAREALAHAAWLWVRCRRRAPDAPSLSDTRPPPALCERKALRAVMVVGVVRDDDAGDGGARDPGAHEDDEPSRRLRRLVRLGVGAAHDGRAESSDVARRQGEAERQPAERAREALAHAAWLWVRCRRRAPDAPSLSDTRPPPALCERSEHGPQMWRGGAAEQREVWQPAKRTHEGCRARCVPRRSAPKRACPLRRRWRQRSACCVPAHAW